MPAQPNTEERNIRDSQKSRNRELSEQITFLVEKVQQLSNELQTTRQSHQLSSDQSRAEIAMLQSEIKNQRTRHEEIVSTLRKRLVESEMARNKMQEQMMRIVEEENKKEHAVNARWNEMVLKVNEDAKWVDEQMTCWKESLDEHEKRIGCAKAQGEINAGMPMGSNVTRNGGEVGNEDTAAERRRQRRAMLDLDEEFSGDNGP
jgi:DNA repair exonuclease SbcCD ATPase subunit